MRLRARTTIPFLALAALLFVAAACRPVRAQSGDRTVSIEVGGRTRTSIVHVPPSYVPGTPVPLVLLFHGGGGNGAQAQRSYAMDPIADRENFIVAYPNGTSRGANMLTWNAANCCAYAYENNVDDVAFVRALLDELARQYAIDARRIYATGMSNGAMFSYRLGCQLSDRIAAIAPVAGALNEETCAPVGPLPAMIFHGTEDHHVLYEGGVGPESLYPRTDRSVGYAVSFWVAHDECDPTPATETSASGNVVKDTYANGAGGSEVVLYTIRGGGHAWPGGSPGSSMADVPTQEISASELMWEFFARHPKAVAATASVRVASPNGGEKFRRGDTVDVRWSVEASAPVASQELWLSADGGASYATRIATIDDAGARSFAWTIPRDLPKGKKYRIRVFITTTDRATAEDASDANWRVKR